MKIKIKGCARHYHVTKSILAGVKFWMKISLNNSGLLCPSEALAFKMKKEALKTKPCTQKTLYGVKFWKKNSLKIPLY